MVVDALGYETKVSSVVGVPPAVTDLDLALTPLAVSGEEIGLSADRNTVASGETFQIFVRANSAAGLFGVSADLAFSPGVLEVTNVALGGGLSADVVATNVYTNADGQLCALPIPNVERVRPNVLAADCCWLRLPSMPKPVARPAWR